VKADLTGFVRRTLDQSAPEDVRAFARSLAEKYGAQAALFYGSNLRRGDREGVLDFYLLGEKPHRRGLRRMVESILWPEVGYHEQGELRAKVAVMTLAAFRRAARGGTLDTTIWARFVQPTALLWAADPDVARRVESAVAAAAITAGRFAAALGPEQAPPRGYWRALFRRTYSAELRVERSDRADKVIDFAPDHYMALLPLAWRAGGLAFHEADGELVLDAPQGELRRLRRAWRLREFMGKPLNAARLVKAAFTFEGAARYALWKIERHTGIALPLTPFREQHPILSAPAVLWRLARVRRQAK
jgi:hypothetical protein